MNWQFIARFGWSNNKLRTSWDWLTCASIYLIYLFAVEQNCRFVTHTHTSLPFVNIFVISVSYCSLLVLRGTFSITTGEFLGQGLIWLNWFYFAICIWQLRSISVVVDQMSWEFTVPILRIWTLGPDGWDMRMWSWMKSVKAVFGYCQSNIQFAKCFQPKSNKLPSSKLR